MFGPPKWWLTLSSVAWVAAAVGGIWASLAAQPELRFSVIVVVFLLIWWGAYIAGGWLQHRGTAPRPRRLKLRSRAWVPYALSALWVAYPLAVASPFVAEHAGVRVSDIWAGLSLFLIPIHPAGALLFVAWLVLGGALWVELTGRRSFR